MAQNSSIEWTDHTFNPWRGCTKVSPGCQHCYAETLSKRNPAVLGVWGKGQPRVRASAAMWQQPLKWNAAATRFLECFKCGWRGVSNPSAVCPTPDCLTFFSEMPNARPRVFCASLADWLDDEVPVEWLADMLRVIACTPNLDWLLLTKRPENWESRLRLAAVHLQTCQHGHWNDPAWRLIDSWVPWNGVQTDAPPANVWIGTTVENQAYAGERVPMLLSIPARMRFLSCEPLLGPLNLREIAKTGPAPGICALTGGWAVPRNDGTHRQEPRIHWVIAGGESGPGARPMHPDWARSLRNQCESTGVPFLFKQWGEHGLYPATVERNNEVVVADDGTAYGPAELVVGGSRRADAIRSSHDKASLHSMYRIGKKAAGRLLDGREHNEFPAVLQPA